MAALADQDGLGSDDDVELKLEGVTEEVEEAGDVSRPASSYRSMCQRMEEEEETPRFISDGIHGQVEVPLVCQAIIHSPQFDRLRSLKQLGCSHYVFPGAKHTRMEHSLGVMHLAGEFLQHLMLKRPGCATRTDRLCVMMAGLCHDLGHGPFSHLWEQFVAEARPGHRWNHETSSLQMLDTIIRENDLMPLFRQHGIEEKDIVFVKELIFGPLDCRQEGEGGEWPFLGRGPEKFFLYEFIANKQTSVDVDKWDYMLRDAAAMDVKTIFNYQRFINNSDITLVEGRMRLCIRDKEKENVGYLFQDRSRLHKNYYQHKTVKVVDRMTVDALLLADPHLALLGRDAAGRVLRMSEACDDVADFLKLSDDFVLRSIQFSEGPELAAARRLVTRIATRNLYKLVGEVTNAPGSAAACERQMNDIIRQERERGVPMNLVVGDVVVTKKKIGFGGVQNPLEKVIFFDKRGRAITCPVTEVMEAVATVDTLLVMCKRSQEETLAIQEAKDLFEKWLVQEQGDKVI